MLRFTCLEYLKTPAAWLDVFVPVLDPDAEFPAGTWDFKAELTFDQLGRALALPGSDEIVGPHWFLHGIRNKAGKIQSVHRRERSKVKFSFRTAISMDHSRCLRCSWRLPDGFTSLAQAMSDPEVRKSLPTSCNPTRRKHFTDWILELTIPRAAYLPSRE